MSRRGPRQKMDGSGWDWTSIKSRRILTFCKRVGVGKFIKRQLARARRREPIEAD